MLALPRPLTLIGIGALAGFLSGLFGIGGGVLIVPALVLLLHTAQKQATGTSLVAVTPIAITATLSYFAVGSIEWGVALPIMLGMVAGGSFGSWLLAKLPTQIISWVFVVVLTAVAVRLWFQDPPRGVETEIALVTVLFFALLGVIAGLLSGLVGIGGGIIIVPALMVFWGLGDLVAKGASLVAMIPSAIITSGQNLRRGNAELLSGMIIGFSGAGTAILGAWSARAIDPRSGSIVFGIFLLLIAAQLILRLIRQRAY